MNNSSGSYRVSFHVSHPVLSANTIVSLIGLPTRYARSVGDLRMTKQGKELGGIYSRTDISFYVSDGVVNNDEILLPDFLNKAIDGFPLMELEQMVVSGGSLFFLIGIYSEDNIMCNFDIDFLSRLANHYIGLKLDFYGGKDCDVDYQ